MAIMEIDEDVVFGQEVNKSVNPYTEYVKNVFGWVAIPNSMVNLPETIWKSYCFAIYLINTNMDTLKDTVDRAFSLGNDLTESEVSTGVRILESILGNNVLQYNLQHGICNGTLYMDINLPLENINLFPLATTSNVLGFNKEVDYNVLDKTAYARALTYNSTRTIIVIREGMGYNRFAPNNLDTQTPIPLNVKNSNYLVDNANEFLNTTKESRETRKSLALSTVLNKFPTGIGHVTMCFTTDVSGTYKVIYPNNTISNIPSMQDIFLQHEADNITKSIFYTEEQVKLNVENNFSKLAGVIIISITYPSRYNTTASSPFGDMLANSSNALYMHNNQYYINTGYSNLNSVITLATGRDNSSMPIVDIYFVAAAELLHGSVIKEDTGIAIISELEYIRNIQSKRIPSNANSSYYKRNLKQNVSSSKSYLELDINMPNSPTISTMYTNLFNNTIPITVNKDYTLPEMCSIKTYNNSTLTNNISIPIDKLKEYNIHTKQEECLLSNSNIAMDNKELEKKELELTKSKLELERSRKELNTLNATMEHERSKMAFELEKLEAERIKLDTQYKQELTKAMVEKDKLKVELEELKLELETKVRQDTIKKEQEQLKLEQERVKLEKLEQEAANQLEKFTLENAIEYLKQTTNAQQHVYKMQEHTHKHFLDVLAEVNKQTLKTTDAIIDHHFDMDKHEMHMEELSYKRLQNYADNVGKIATSIGKFI